MSALKKKATYTFESGLIWLGMNVSLSFFPSVDGKSKNKNKWGSYFQGQQNYTVHYSTCYSEESAESQCFVSNLFGQVLNLVGDNSLFCLYLAMGAVLMKYCSDFVLNMAWFVGLFSIQVQNQICVILKPLWCFWAQIVCVFIVLHWSRH